MPPGESGPILQYGFLICQWGCAKYLNGLQLFPLPAVLKSSNNEIVTNLTLNQLERRRVPTVPLSGPEDASAVELPLPDPSADPESAYLAGERQVAIHRAILRLPPRYRAVIELRHFQELSYAEIATTLGIPESDVKSHLFRARQLLREYLQHE